MMGPVQARALRAIAIGAAAMAVLAPSAGATIVDGGKFSGSETGVPDSLCGIDLVRDSTFSGSASKHWTKTGAVGESRPFFFNVSASRASSGRPMLAK